MYLSVVEQDMYRDWTALSRILHQFPYSFFAVLPWIEETDVVQCIHDRFGENAEEVVLLFALHVGVELPAKISMENDLFHALPRRYRRL